MSANNPNLSQTRNQSLRATDSPTPEGWWCGGVGLGKKKVDSGLAQVNHVSISSSFKINFNLNLSNFVSWLDRPVSSEVTSVFCVWRLARLAALLIFPIMSWHLRAQRAERAQVWLFFVWNHSCLVTARAGQPSLMWQTSWTSVHWNMFHCLHCALHSFLRGKQLILFYNNSYLQYLIFLKCKAMSIHLDRTEGDI